jgi:predicted RNA-binding Zn-ribbon protein involved in translation (DUF1610 family)
MGLLADFREVLKELKHKKVDKKTITVCPKCGSKNIFQTNQWVYGILPKQYACTECDYKGPIVMELTKTDNKTD